MPYHWIAAGDTDLGRARDSNEDAFAIHSPEGIYVLADGMGGHAAGEVASRIAVDEIVAGLRETDPGSPRRAPAAQAIQRANARILSEADRQVRYRGMGTTATLLWVDPGSAAYVIGHVGFSSRQMPDDCHPSRPAPTAPRASWCRPSAQRIPSDPT